MNRIKPLSEGNVMHVEKGLIDPNKPSITPKQPPPIHSSKVSKERLDKLHQVEIELIEAKKYIDVLTSDLKFVLQQSGLVEHFQNSEKLRELRKKYNVGW
jgi:hypothetical protein